jgi:hypothetical protein
MEPQYMILGQAAGTAAALAVRAGVPVQRVDITELQRALRRDGQILTLEGAPNGPFATDSTFLIDDDMRRFVERRGSWEHLEHPVNRHAMSYLLSNDAMGTIRYTPDLPALARYEVAAWWPEGVSDAAKVPVAVGHAAGVDTVFVDQRGDGGRWVSLGMWSFDAGQGGFVEIQGSDARVAADAVRFTRKP